MKNLRREIKNCLAKRLLPFGFVPKGKYARFVRTKANTVQIIGLGFSNGSRNVTADMNVLYPNINEIMVKLGEYDLMKAYQGMVTGTMGMLMPETEVPRGYKEWHFRKEDMPDSLDATIDEMISDIVQYGFPYFDELLDGEVLLDKLLSDPSQNRYLCFGVDKLIPVLYHLRGEDALAMDYIKKTIQKEGEWPSKEEMEKLLSMGDIVIIGNQSVSMNDYLAFAINFKKFIEAGH